METLKAVFFSHAKEEFKDEMELRDWLDLDLRIYRKGEYHLRKGQGLGKIEEGSFVFFHRNGWIVGYAIVERPVRKTTDYELERYGEVYEHVVKFIPESISAWGDNQFLSNKDVEKIIGKKLSRGYTIVDKLPQLLKIFKEFAKKSQV